MLFVIITFYAVSSVELEVSQTGFFEEGEKVIGILGTGRMGTHLAATWAAAGHSVILGSRDRTKSDFIVSSITAGSGYVGGGGEQIPPFIVDNLRLTAGSLSDAVKADIIVLATPFPVTVDLIHSLKAEIIGKGKIIIDITNPWYSGEGLPANGPQSAVEIHRNALDDPTAHFGVAYKNVLWTKILPGKKGVRVSICGDRVYRQIVTSLISSHGFKTVDGGGLESAVSLEPGRPVTKQTVGRRK